MHASELNLESFAENTQDGILVHCGDRFVYANRSIEEMLGYAPGELLNAAFPHIIAVDQAAQADYINEDNGKPHTGQYEILLKHKDGNYCPVEITAAAGNWHGKPTTVVIVRDISEHKRAEDALLLSEERLSRSLHYANIGNWDWNIQTGALYWSERVSPLFGYETGEMETTYEAFLAAIHPDDRQRVEDAINTCLETGRDYDIEHRILWQDGTIHWLHEAGGVVYDDHGQAVQMLGIVQDITKRKLAKQALVESEEKYRAVMENASDAILLETMAGWIIDANHCAEEFLGYTRDELLQMHGTAIHPKEDHPVLTAAFRDLASKGSSLYEHLMLRKDGSVVNAEVAATMISYQGEKLVMAIFRDTTARKRAEEERLTHAKAQRDTLVREVHHRIKNNLQGVVGLLRQHATRHPELSGTLDSAIGQVNSMALVHGLYGQAGRDSIILCEMISAICHSARGLTGKAVEPHVTIDVERPVRLATDEAVPLALILNELIFNAIKHHSGDRQPVRVYLHYEADVARVSIVNPDARLPPGFDFSTAQGLGTGLNLVRSLLPNAGCQLRITNEAAGVVAELQLAPPVILHP